MLMILLEVPILFGIFFQSDGALPFSRALSRAVDLDCFRKCGMQFCSGLNCAEWADMTVGRVPAQV